MSAPILTQINIYPLKSGAALSLSNSWVEEAGLAFDRRFMVVDQSSNEFITARDYPCLHQVTAALLPNGVHLGYPEKSGLQLLYSNFLFEPVNTRVWGDQFEAWSTFSEADSWFSDILEKPVRLLFVGHQSSRYRAKLGRSISFADGYPLLLLSQASLDQLNSRCQEPNLMVQFRPNLVISGTTPHEEDRWRRIRIGEVEFEVAKPCTRCVMTTIDPADGQFRATQEPLTTLAKYRRQENGAILFGQNLVPLNQGKISCGDTVEVLTTGAPPVFVEAPSEALELHCVEQQNLTADMRTFWFESKGGGALPHYQPGQHLPMQFNIGQEQLTRYYSLCSSPHQLNRYSITVKRIGDGKVSNWLHDSFEVGQSLRSLPPTGAFKLGIERNLLLLSAGSGVTPILSMVRWLAEQGQLAQVVYYHQCRTEQDIPALAELEQIRVNNPGFRVLYSLTRPGSGWQGLIGRLDKKMLADAVPDVSDREVYACGPNGFLDSAKVAWVELGGRAKHFYQESFGPLLERNGDEQQVLDINIAGQQFKGNNQEPLLIQAEHAGINIPSACRAGVCGACRVRLVHGEVEQLKGDGLSVQDKEEGRILACSCLPLSDLEIELN